MRRDNTTVFAGNDDVGFIFDTFYDRRNGVVFTVNAIGGRIDGQVTNERSVQRDWNPIWDVKVGRFDGGWTLEAAVPFKSLRYQPGRAQIWGFNVAPREQALEERESRFSRGFRARRCSRRSCSRRWRRRSSAWRRRRAARNLEIKPYVISNLTTDLDAAPRVANDVDGDVGVDVEIRHHART